MTIEQIKEASSHLSASERAELAAFLLHSIDSEEEEINEAEWKAAWHEEVARRLEEFRSGKAVGVPAEQVFARLRERHR